MQALPCNLCLGSSSLSLALAAVAAHAGPHMLPALWWQLAQHILLLPPDHDCAGQHAVQLLLIGGPCSHGMPVSIST